MSPWFISLTEPRTLVSVRFFVLIYNIKTWIYLGLFLDGVLNDGVNWPYPKPAPNLQKTTYTIGNNSPRAQMSWCLSSVYLLSTPLGILPSYSHTSLLTMHYLGNEHLRFIHHLGPRYAGNFQDPNLVKLLTYEGSTSLNMYLSTIATKNNTPPELSLMMKVVKNGLAIPESQIVFSFLASDSQKSGQGTDVHLNSSSATLRATGDVFTVKAACLDMALWKIGGAAIVLRLVDLANVRLYWP